MELLRLPFVPTRRFGGKLSVSAKHLEFFLIRDEALQANAAQSR